MVFGPSDSGVRVQRGQDAAGVAIIEAGRTASPGLALSDVPHKSAASRFLAA